MIQWIVIKFTLTLIGIYQKTISLDHGFIRKFTNAPRCKFYPTCSEYAKGALLKHGILRGTRLTAGRLLRCNPWNKGGIDQA